MIKFFRNIRENLLNEGKTTKYFKYAIGEILLVVIGILIALQINNWNENQKQKKRETVYLENLRDDLATQIESLDIYINFESIIIQDTKDIIAHYERHNGFYKMDSIYSKLNDLSVRWTFVNANTTLLEMVNSGQINLISNRSLKKELMDFNQLLLRFASNTLKNNTNLIDNLIVPNIINHTNYASESYSESMKTQFQAFNPMGFIEIVGGNLKESADSNLTVPKFSLTIMNNVVFRNAMATMQKSGNEALKENASELKKHIEAELNQ